MLLPFPSNFISSYASIKRDGKEQKGSVFAITFSLSLSLSLSLSTAIFFSLSFSLSLYIFLFLSLSSRIVPTVLPQRDLAPTQFKRIERKEIYCLCHDSEERDPNDLAIFSPACTSPTFATLNIFASCFRNKKGRYLVFPSPQARGVVNLLLASFSLVSRGSQDMGENEGKAEKGNK